MILMNDIDHSGYMRAAAAPLCGVSTATNNSLNSDTGANPSQTTQATDPFDQNMPPAQSGKTVYNQDGSVQMRYATKSPSGAAMQKSVTLVPPVQSPDSATTTPQWQ